MERVVRSYIIMNVTQGQFNKAEKEVFKQLFNIFNDLLDSISILRKKDRKYIKSELCLAFIAADTFSRFFDIFSRGEKFDEIKIENKERFVSWLSKFVFIKDNEYYRKYKNEINCNPSNAWKYRNALVHFYGRPRDEGESLILGNPPQEIKKKFRRAAKNNNFNHELRFINPHRLIKVIFKGLELQLSEMKEEIANNPNKYIFGILKCNEIMGVECSKYISLNN